MRRRNEATERSRTSSARKAVTKVRRPRSFGGAARGAAGRAAAGRAAPGAPGRRDTRGASSSSASMTLRPGAGFLTSSSTTRRFLATSPALRLDSSSTLWRASSSRLRSSAASRSACSMPSLEARRRASSSAILRSSASRTLESASAWARATRSSSVKVRSTTPDFGSGGFGAGAGAGAAAAFFGASTGAGSALASGPPTVRRFLTSTTTCLLRPWLKLWRTTPVSVRGLSDKVSFFSPGFLVSLIPYCFLGHRPPVHSNRVYRPPALARQPHRESFRTESAAGA